MLHKLSSWIVEKIFISNIKLNEECKIYVYGMEILFAYIVNIGSFILIGMLLNMLSDAITFISVFFTLRAYAGGFHAKNYKRCYIMSCIILISILLFLKYFRIDIKWITVLMILSIIGIELLCPVSNENKKLNKREKAVFKRRNNIRLLFIVSVIMVLCILKRYQIMYSMMVAVIIVAMLAFVGLVKEKKYS